MTQQKFKTSMNENWRAPLSGVPNRGKIKPIKIKCII